MNTQDNFDFVQCLKKNKEIYGAKVVLSDRYKNYTFEDVYYYCGRISYFIKEQLKSKGNCIGVIADGSSKSILIMLGIICSGNFYLPLDPILPQSQLNAILEKTQMKMLILLKDSKEDFLCDIPCYFLERIIFSNFKELYFAEIGADEPLYAILTSGSTGEPKILLKTHKAMLLYISTFSRTFCLNSELIIGNQIPFYSDAAQKDLFLMLYLGAHLQLIPQFLFSVPYALIQYLNQNKIDFISWVPSAYGMVAQFDIFKKIRPFYLKYSFWVGESIHKKVVEYWKSYLVFTEFYNIYGMSEIAGVCSYYNMNNTVDEVIPIGIPLEHCKLIFRDECGCFVNQGELLIQSEALASYVFTDKGKKELEKICIEGEYYYRTGDYGYLNARNEFVVTGRKDEQIKLNGYRIELQGLERIFLEYENVDEVAVVFVNKRIVAFIVLKQDDVEKRENLIKYAKQNIPRYSIPEKYVFLDTMPYNRNGKKDKGYLQSRLQKE